EPTPPRKLDRRIPRDLETLVLKAMAKEPKRRYASAAEFAEDLRRFLADKPIEARRASWFEKSWRWCRRNPSLAVSSLSGMVLLVAIAVVASVAALWLRDERNATRQQLQETQRAEREGQQRLYQARLAQAQASRLSGRPRQRFGSLQALSEAASL